MLSRGLIVQQLVHNEDGEDITVFFRLNRGKEPVDHHVFFFYQGKDPPFPFGSAHTSPSPSLDVSP